MQWEQEVQRLVALAGAQEANLRVLVRANATASGAGSWAFPVTKVSDSATTTDIGVPDAALAQP